MSLSRALEIAVLAAREGGDILRADLHRPGGPRGGGSKADADLEAEHVIRARLQAAFPAWGYRGEETEPARGEPGAPVWLVDPNDGTVDYLKGWRGSAVSIGLVHEGRPVLGVVFAFAWPDHRGDLFAWAEGGGPATRNGVPLSPSLPASLGPQDVVLVSGGGDRRPAQNLRCVEPARYACLTSIAHRLARLGAGECAAATSIHSPGDWDYGGGHALVRAAGGVLLDESGREVGYDADGRSSVRWLMAGRREVAEVLRTRPWDDASAPGAWGPDRPARLERGRLVSDPDLLARAQGCLLGQVAGDSLGALVEFQSARSVAAAWPDGPRLLVDGGTWDTLAGQPTDDSEMALALARSIVERGTYDPDAAFAAYTAWGDSHPFDMGGTTSAALGGRPVPGSEANGSLMRVSPLAIHAHALPAAEVAIRARSDSGLTHPHPVCGDSVAAFAIAVGVGLRGGDPAQAHAAALEWARSASAQPSVLSALERAAAEAPVCDVSSQGWVLIALQNAFYELLHAPSLEEGVVRTVRRGGDTDTNAAIAGALLGAVHGRDAIPAPWRHMVLSCRPHDSRLGIARPRPARYWPVDVLELAERLLLTG